MFHPPFQVHQKADRIIKVIKLRDEKDGETVFDEFKRVMSNALEDGRSENNDPACEQVHTDAHEHAKYCLDPVAHPETTHSSLTRHLFLVRNQFLPKWKVEHGTSLVLVCNVAQKYPNEPPESRTVRPTLCRSSAVDRVHVEHSQRKLAHKEEENGSKSH